MPSLEALIASDIEVAAVVTNPDRPAGRKLELHAPPVKETALAAGIEVLQPDKARDPDFQTRLKEIGPDVAPVVAYGKILPASVLDIPLYGFVNLHFSLLPEYRGAAPVQRAVMDGVEKTGASVMVLTEGMDEGPVLGTSVVDVGEDETAGELGNRLAEVGAPLLVDSLKAYVAGEINPQEQDHEAATYAPKITSEEARIDWAKPADEIRNHVRGLNPAPGAWTTFKDGRLRVLRSIARDGEGTPGQVLDPKTLVVATQGGALELTEVQPAGKRVMSGVEFARGHQTDSVGFI